MIKVWYGTNRAPVSSPTKSIEYTTKLDDRLHYGQCRVCVPQVPDASGGMGNFIRSWVKIGNKRKSSKVDQINQAYNSIEFISDLQGEILKSNSDSTALVYVHGYNNSFREAAITAAEFSLAIKYPGITAFFSWPSSAKIRNYQQDEAIVSQSDDQLLEFLLTLMSTPSLEAIDVIVHSLGNRLFLDSITTWVQKIKPSIIPLRNVYLGAPDVDARDFKLRSTMFSRVAQKTTLYASKSDSALLASHVFNKGTDRVGFVPPIFVDSSMDTIEASAANSSRLGHNYLINSMGVRSDIFNIQSGHVDPNTRPNLRSSPGSDYWIFS